MPHLVILLPGIMGSVLQKDGKDLWALSGQALWQHLRFLGSTIQQLQVADDDWTVDDRGDGVHAARLIEDLHSVPPLIEHAGYSVIRRGITEFFGLTEGSVDEPVDSASFFTFPYDWRRDNRVAARKLQQFIQRQLPRWREYSGRKNAQVILVGHSMGGLVARYYLEVLGGWRDCRAVITVGSPHRGAIGALDSISNGFKKFSISFASLTGLVRSFPSAYQLLPTYPAVCIDDDYVRPADTDAIPNLDRALAKAGRQDFLEAIRLAAIENAKESDYAQRLIPWVGTRQDTFQSAVVSQGGLITSYDPPRGLDASLADGDGTVPRISAIPADLDGRRFERFSVERHGWLTNNKMTLQPLLETLLQVGSPGAPTFFGIDQPEAISPSISLRLDSLFLPEEPVALHLKLVQAGEQPQPIDLGIRPVGHAGEGATRTVQVGGTEPALVELGELAPGLYELTAAPSATGASEAQTMPPVHAAFEVIDTSAVE
jgi:pimeloyl-ACP methyl ester carboxylesterase